MLRKLAVWIVLVLMLTTAALAEDTAPSFVDRITKKNASPEFDLPRMRS